MSESLGESSGQSFEGTIPVREAHRFDTERLAAYLRQQVESFAGPIEVEQFRGGQSNPTYLVRAGGRRYVLRRKPPGKLLPSAHAVEREHRVITALAGTDVPVPKTYALCTDESVIGTAFYIMDYVEGRVLWDPAQPGSTPAGRAAVFDEMNRVIAALHRVDYEAVGLGEYGKPGSYFARQIDRWTRQYRASETETIEAADNLIAWLPQHIPPGDQTRIVHAEPNCYSRELYKGVLDDASHGVFNGKVYVHPEAQKTDGKQTNNTLLLSERARIDTKPQLEIFADDVKCTHGATVGRIDETALFYMKSRGIPNREARKLLTYAFAAEVLETIPIDALRDGLERLTLERFTGTVSA